jgi:prolyl-tRNA editing enzyme YbaK/EbsC (Cys-tRNA(Pro) deacylase)
VAGSVVHHGRVDAPADLPASARRVAIAAGELGLPIDIQTFPDGTRTAEDAAQAVGCDVGQIVKSLVFVAGEQPVLALVAGDNRLDEARLAAVAGVDAVRRADADEVRSATSFAVGGVPPFGHPSPLPTWVDVDLLDHEVVWAAAGTPRHVFAVDPRRLADAAGATPAHLAAG